MESKLFVSESHVFGGYKTGQKDVDTLSDCERHSNNTISARLSVETANKIGQVIQDRQIVFDQNDVIIVGLNSSYEFGHLDSLLNIEIRSWLIENVNSSLLNQYDHHSKSL